MTSSVAAQPTKRGPGRPRKAAVVSDVEPEVEPVVESGEVEESADPRIGQTVDDDRWTAIVFPDDTQYRIDNGVIVERVR